MRNRKSIRSIIKKYLKGKATSDEEHHLLSFYKRIEPKQADWDEAAHGNKKALENKLLEKIYDQIDRKQHTTKMSRPLFTSWKAVASIILLCGVTYLVLNRNRISITNKRDFVIQPGSDKAVLQLADGRTVYLDSLTIGEIYTKSGPAIHMAKKGELTYTQSANAGGENGTNIITVPKGGQFKVTLADGTSVWLNASSSLTYPVHFSSAERRVKLSGEAYFDVSQQTQKGSKGEKVPFIVETDKQVVEVLGTSFNINAYSDEETVRTTLISGAVKVTSSDKHLPKILKPGQQSILAKGKLSIKKVEASQAVAWKHGDFTFDEMPLEEIMRQIARWYDVEVNYQGEVGKIQFGGSISRSKNIQEVLDVLTLTGVQFTVKGRRIMVRP